MADRKPVGVAGTASGTEDAPFGGQVTATDADNDQLTYALVKPITGLLFNPDGTFTFDPQAGGFNKLAANQTGVLNFQFVANDGQMSSAPATEKLVITGVNDAPTAGADGVKVTLAGSASKPITITAPTLLKNDTDPDTGDHLTISSLDGASLHYGTVSLKAGNVVFTPNDAGKGLHGATPVGDVFTYTVQDKAGASSSATVTLTISGPNAAPVAKSAAASGDEDHAIPGQVTATDADGDPLTYKLVKPASAYPGLDFHSDGSFTYDPTSTFNKLGAAAKGTLAFQYTASDGVKSSTATETLTITGINDAPTATADSLKIMLTGSASKPVTIAAPALLKNDTDPDTGDHLIISAVDGTGLHYGAVGLMNGNVVFTPNDTAKALHGAGTLSDTFGYTIVDKAGVASSSTVTLTLAGPNAAPIAKTGGASGNEDHTIPGQVTGSDADGDPLTYKLVKPVSGLTFNPDGSFTYDPTVTFNSLRVGTKGTLAFKFVATDGVKTSAQATETLTIAGLNDAPTAYDDKVAYTGANKAALTIAGATLTKNDTDPDTGHILSLKSVNGAQSEWGTVALSKGNAVYTPDEAIFTVNTGAGSTGLTDSFAETIEDKVGAPSTAQVNLTLTGTSVAGTAAANMTANDDLVVLDVSKLANATFDAHGNVVGYAKINGFDTAHDKLATFNDALMHYASSTYYDGAASSLTNAADMAAAAAANQNANAMFFHYADGTYLMTDHGTAGEFGKGDGLIKVTGAQFTAGQDPAWHIALPNPG